MADDSDEASQWKVSEIFSLSLGNSFVYSRMSLIAAAIEK